MRPPGAPVEPGPLPAPPGDRRARLLGGGRRRREGARGVAIAVASTVVFFTAAAVVISRSPGWPAIRAAFFHGGVFVESFPKVLERFGRNVFIFSVAEVLVLVLALSYGIFKKSRFAAVVMLLYFALTLGLALVAYFVKFGVAGNLLLFLGAILFLGGFFYYFVQGIIGTFAYFSLVYESAWPDAGESQNKEDK